VRDVEVWRRVVDVATWKHKGKAVEEVVVARMEEEEVVEVEEQEIGSSQVGSSGKVSLSEKAVLVLLAGEQMPSRRALGSCQQGGFPVALSRHVSLTRVLSERVPLSRMPSTRVRVLEAGQRRISLASGPDSVHGRCYGSSWFWDCRCLTGRAGLDSLRT